MHRPFVHFSFSPERYHPAINDHRVVSRPTSLCAASSLPAPGKGSRSIARMVSMAYVHVDLHVVSLASSQAEAQAR
jgi:hypothetical protein